MGQDSFIRFDSMRIKWVWGKRSRHRSHQSRWPLLQLLAAAANPATRYTPTLTDAATGGTNSRHDSRATTTTAAHKIGFHPQHHFPPR
ncbi:hypothetical protein WN943_027143 [Citrus x changshan-huyou]